jgi:hypothetical protein
MQGTTGSDWTPEEQTTLENALSRFPADKVIACQPEFLCNPRHAPHHQARDISLL